MVTIESWAQLMPPRDEVLYDMCAVNGYPIVISSAMNVKVTFRVPVNGLRPSALACLQTADPHQAIRSVCMFPCAKF